MSKNRGKSGLKSDSLSGMTVTLSGKFSLPRRQFVRLIQEHGATVIVNVTKRVSHIITTPEDARNKTIRIQQALKYDLPLLDEAYIHACIEAGKPVEEDDYYIRVKGNNGKKVPSIRPPAPKVETESNGNSDQSGADASPGNPSSHSNSGDSGPSTPRRRSGRKSRSSSRTSPNHKNAANSNLNLATRPKRHLESAPEPQQPLKIMKRTPEIDPYANQPSHAKVVDDGFDNVYDVMLRLSYNDHDEFCIMQLIDASRHYMGKEKYVFFTRSGTVGSNGEPSSKTYRSKDKALREFEKRFYDMTLNNWNNRRTFSKTRGKFEYIPFGYTKRLFSGEEYDSDEVNTTTETDTGADANDEATAMSESHARNSETENDTSITEKKEGHENNSNNGDDQSKKDLKSVKKEEHHQDKNESESTEQSSSESKEDQQEKESAMETDENPSENQQNKTRQQDNNQETGEDHQQTVPGNREENQENTTDKQSATPMETDNDNNNNNGGSSMDIEE
eukprot:gb/GECH01000096.1/.p1 GENE.gb/GECH01000096.1/~~gb/GECH01000096.1/.p1  ORF type:complete len:505 (+),score=146.41 gb/GECH01000096.1/:1-1515(+)